MANWLERARREIPRSADRGTAKADEGTLSAVTAVANQGESGNLRASIGSNGSAPVAVFPEIKAVSAVAADQEAAIRSWLAQIDETDEAVIAHVLNRSQQNPDARDYFMRQTSGVPRADPFPDDRRCCDQCANLTGRGLCLAARRGEIVANRDYEPVRDMPRRCEGYRPGVDDPDRRTGRERWPDLIQRGDE